ncbi:MAG: glycine cleavage T C-terminal barrel domain-containing protein, partial [Nitrospinota bacterium]
RTEMKYALYGNDITAETTPLEAGLGWVVKFKKGDFIGRASLLRQREEGLRRRLVGFEMVERGIPRPSQTLLVGSAPGGFVTSGTMSPSLDKAIGIGYVPAEYARPGTELAVDIRGKPRRAVVVETPFYRRPGG